MYCDFQTVDLINLDIEPMFMEEFLLLNQILSFCVGTVKLNTLPKNCDFATMSSKMGVTLSIVGGLYRQAEMSAAPDSLGFNDELSTTTEIFCFVNRITAKSPEGSANFYILSEDQEKAPFI